MGEQTFTVEQANELLGELRPVAEEMVRLHRSLREAQDRRAEIAAHAAGNGAGVNPKELAALEEQAQRNGEALARCIAQIAEQGVLVKDLDTGLLDFPSERDGEEIVLCWRVGEPEIGWWHGVEEGFAGRKPL